MCFLQLLVEDIEQFPDYVCLRQCVPEQPYRFCVRYPIPKMQTQKPHKANAVIDLVFGLVIAQVIDPLKYQNLEQHEVVIRRTPSGPFCFLFEQLCQSRPEQLPVYGTVQTFQGIPQLAQPL